MIRRGRKMNQCRVDERQSRCESETCAWRIEEGRPDLTAVRLERACDCGETRQKECEKTFEMRRTHEPDPSDTLQLRNISRRFSA